MDEYCARGHGAGRLSDKGTGRAYSAADFRAGNGILAAQSCVSRPDTRAPGHAGIKTAADS